MRSARLLVLLAVGTLAAGGVAFAASGSVIKFTSAPIAPRSARSLFSQRGSLLPASTLRRLKLAQTRRIAVEKFPGQAASLFVAPATGGSFCSAWALSPAPGAWIAEFSSCGIQKQPVTVGYDDTRFNIVANRLRVDRVVAKLSDHSTVQLSVRWVSAPINAGFVLYQPPSGITVAEIDGLHGLDVVSTEPISHTTPTP